MTEAVVVLHGLGRSAWSMFRLEHALTRQGYLVYNETYPSRDFPVEQLAAKAIEPALQWARLKGVSRVHFVTHSLGGILVRYYLQSNPIEALGRVVMLSPPNRGSVVADMLLKLKLYRKFSGPVGHQLGTHKESLPNSLKPVNAEIGVIAGTLSSDPWFSAFIHEPSDGKVTVSNTMLDEMRDFIVVRHGHTYIMNSRQVMEQISHFLSNGQFLPGTSELSRK